MRLTENDIRTRMERVFITNKKKALFSRYICPELNIDTVLIKSWAYAMIKKAERELNSDSRTKVYVSRPPEYVMAMPLKDQMLWEWKFREALRIQMRKSFWVDITGLEPGILDDMAEAVGIKFNREVITQKEYNSRRNSLKSTKKNVEAVITLDEQMGNQSFVFNWEDVCSEAERYKSDMETQSLFYRVTVELPRGRSTCCVKAADIRHMAMILTAYYHRRIVVIRTELLTSRPGRREYELWLSGERFVKDVTIKSGVTFEKNYDKINLTIPKDVSVVKKSEDPNEKTVKDLL